VPYWHSATPQIEMGKYDCQSMCELWVAQHADADNYLLRSSGHNEGL